MLQRNIIGAGPGRYSLPPCPHTGKTPETKGKRKREREKKGRGGGRRKGVRNAQSLGEASQHCVTATMEDEEITTKMVALIARMSGHGRYAPRAQTMEDEGE